MNHVGRKASRWTYKHLTDCLPEVLSGRADPDRGGRHQHSLRDLGSCENGSSASGPQAAAPLVVVAPPPLYDDDTPSVPRRESPLNNVERRSLGLPPLGRPGTHHPLSPRATDGSRAAPAVLTPTAASRSRKARSTGPVFAAPPSEGPESDETVSLGLWPDVLADMLTGVCEVSEAQTHHESPSVAAVRRVQYLAGGVRPGDVVLAPALLRTLNITAASHPARTKRTERLAKLEAYRQKAAEAGDPAYARYRAHRPTPAPTRGSRIDATAVIEAYRWNVTADGDLGYAAAHRREHCPVLGMTPTVFVSECQALSGRVAADACRAALSWTIPEPAPAPAVRGPLDAALLALVQRDPDLGERSLARALAAEGGTQGRVYRIMQRYGLETAAKRRLWAREQGGGDAGLRAAIAEAAGLLAAEDPGLEPLWRYHLAAAWCRLREGLPVPEALPGVGGSGIAAPRDAGAGTGTESAAAQAPEAQSVAL